MTSRRAGWTGLAASLWVALGACAAGESLTVPPDLVAPDGVAVTAVNVRTNRVQWNAVKSASVSGYRLERRANLAGPFETLVPSIPQNLPGPIVVFDDQVEPETFYGYRVVAVDRIGNESAASTVAGVRSPSAPGISITTVAIAPNPGLNDPDGYTIVIDGPEAVRTPIGVSAERRVSPLPVGNYTVTLTGVAAACSVQGSEVRQVTVSDLTAETIANVQYIVTCRDPSRGVLIAGVRPLGEVPPTAEFVVDVAGIASDAGLPESERVYARTLRFGPGGGAQRLEDLRPGDYEVTVSPVPQGCVRAGPATRNIDVVPLSLDSLLFDVDCDANGDDDPDTSNRPFVYRNLFAPPSAAVGATVELRVGLDLTAVPGSSIGAVEAQVRFNQQVLRYERTEAADTRFSVFANATGPGTISWGAFTTTAGITTQPAMARMVFTVIGDGSAATRTTGVRATLFDFAQIDTLVRVVEDTFAVGAGGGNQPPTAEANGPYTGVVGAAIPFSAAGSADPDGSIVSYAWAFGDGTTGTGASPAKSYFAAGNYTVTLTVTDNGGATATDQASVTITAGGGNRPPVAVVNGPYSGTAGSPVSFSAAGSTDPDGTIASYAWTFGDGGTGTGQAPTHTYAAPGNYTVALAVTDNSGATATAQTTATVTAQGSARPLAWRGSFGPVNPANGLVAYTITYDLSTDLPATPGPEALATWVVDSLKWDPTVLQFFAFNFGNTGTGSVNTNGVLNGRLRFNGTQGAANSTGVVTIATIRFRVIGAAGSSTTTATTLGALLGTPATGSFNYTGSTGVTEATFTVGGGPAPTGTVSGTVTRSTGEGIVGATVTVAPGGSATTSAGGQYSVSGVPAGTGTVSVSSLPTGCSAPSPQAYTITSAGQTATVNLVANCSTGTPTGTVSGTVTRNTGGPVVGATVTVTPGGTATTATTGQYSVSGVPVGTGTVAVSGLPTGCTAPSPASYTLASAGQTATVDVTVTCVATPTGTVSGTVTRSTGGPVSGATVTVSPGGTATTSATGTYAVSGVPLGGGTVTVSGLPSGCTAPAPRNYDVTAAGQTVVVNVTVTCAPAGNGIAGTWTVSGTTATLELRANVVTGNVGSIEFTVTPGSSRLQFTGNSAAAAPNFPNVFVSNPPATVISVGAFTLASSGLTGSVGIVRLAFTILPGAPATVNAALSGVLAANAGQQDISAAFAANISIAPLVLP